jgi:hypothetical protein
MKMVALKYICSTLLISIIPDNTYFVGIGECIVYHS